MTELSDLRVGRAAPDAIDDSSMPRAERLCRFDAWPERNGVRLAGEIDCSNAILLDEELRRLGSAASVYVEASALTFIDVGGLRTLVEASARLDPPAQLVLVEPPHLVLRMLEICEWHETRGFTTALGAGPSSA